MGDVLRPQGRIRYSPEGAPSPQGGTEAVSPEQSVSEMVEEVLDRQAKALVGRTGQPLEAALEEVGDTKAGRQLRELAHSEYQERKAAEWQANLPRRRAEERHYSWLESYM